MTNLPTESQLRNKLPEMTKEEFIIIRDLLEKRWVASYRPLMLILSLGCINKFKTTLSNI